MKALRKWGSRQLPPKLLFQFHHHSCRVLQVCCTRSVSCAGLWDIEEFTLITTQSSNLSHNEWLANLFSSGLPSPELPADFPLAIRRVLTSPFPTSSSSMLELSGWSIDLGQALLELMFLLSLCRVRHLRLIHECVNRSVVQMANLGLDPVNAAEFHMADMLQWSRLLTGTETPPRIPHPASCLINFHVGAIGSQIATNTSFDPVDPDHVNNAVDQLQTLSLSRLVNDQGRSVEVFDPLGNIHPELLMGNVGVDVMVGSGELSPESSVHGLCQRAIFRTILNLHFPKLASPILTVATPLNAKPLTPLYFYLFMSNHTKKNKEQYRHWRRLWYNYARYPYGIYSRVNLTSALA